MYEKENKIARNKTRMLDLKRLADSLYFIRNACFLAFIICYVIRCAGESETTHMFVVSRTAERTRKRDVAILVCPTAA